ncbi:MAG: carbohydrate binding family 9 domain-containing protein [Candidatus Aminicenantes bacterium]|nr:carbohydrate binding family 9 domain-containing protein [Candidatus Aminicenantes bacterium]
MKRLILFCLVSSFVLSSFLAAAELKAVRVKEAPKIDGSLSDPVWQAATPVANFRMVEPQPNQEPTEKTELRILYDEANLYIGIVCYDSEPRRIAANTMLGARGEGLAYAGSSSLNWDGIWEAKSRILENGWSAELRIPFKTISFKPGLTIWGINVERSIARKQETIRLSGTNRDSNFNNPMEAAGLEGIEGVEQGKGITFRPYGLVSAQKTSLDSGAYDWKLDGGFDIYKSFTPNLVGVVSYNMDFAETEVDERRINLTRFPLFFPEKRMFFLEGSETFSFSSSVSFMPFFSRRIGLYEGKQVPVVFGTKLYGKIGSTNLSILDVQTGKFEGLPSNNLLAARMTQNIFAQSKVGWIFTNGSPTGEKNSLAGADFNYSSSKFLGNKNIMLAAWAAYNWNEKKEGRHHGFGFRADYPNDLWNVQSTYAFYGEALEPGLGYMMRTSMQTAFARVAFQPRPEKGFLGKFIRQFFFDASADYYWDLAWNLETSRLTASPLSFRTQSGENIGLSVVANRDVLPYDFELAKGVVLPAGPYDFTSYRFEFRTSTHRAAVFEMNYNFGGFYSGHYDDVSFGLTLKYKGYATLALDTNLVRGRLPQGHFNENVYQIKADIFISPDLGLMNYFQYDDISRLLGWSARLRWQISPGNDIYVVYNKNWERRWDPTSRFFPMEERGVLKISLSLRP